MDRSSHHLHRQTGIEVRLLSRAAELLLQVLYLCLIGIGMVFWFGDVVLTMISAHANGNAPSPPASFMLVPMLWLNWMGVWAARVVIAVVYAVKAGRGEWAEYPFLGQPARRILNLEPGEAAP